MTWPGIPRSRREAETTVVPAGLQPQFLRWLVRNKVEDLDAPDSFYDYRGAFLAGINRDRKTQHWPDTFKQHGHPTFSVESMYAFPDDPEAGHWDGETYIAGPGQQLP